MRLDLLTLRQRASDLQGTVDFVQDLLQSSEDAWDALESTLADTRTRLEEEQIARTQARNELDLLCAYTQSLIDSSIGCPHDVVRLQRVVEARDEALVDTYAKIKALRLQVSILQADSEVMQTEMEYMQQICELGSNMSSAKRLQLLRSLHRVTRVAQSVGAEATTVLEEYKERDPLRSIELGRFCNWASVCLSQI